MHNVHSTEDFKSLNLSLSSQNFRAIQQKSTDNYALAGMFGDFKHVNTATQTVTIAIPPVV